MNSLLNDKSNFKEDGYFQGNGGKIIFNEDGSLAFNMVINGQDRTINFNDFSGKETLLLKTNKGSEALDVLGGAYNRKHSEMMDEAILDKKTAKDIDMYKGYYDGDAENDYTFSKKYKQIDGDVDKLFNGLTEDTFISMVFDAQRDYDGDGNSGNDKKLIETYLDDYGGDNVQINEMGPEYREAFEKAGFTNGTLKEALQEGYYWNEVDGEVLVFGPDDPSGWEKSELYEMTKASTVGWLQNL